MKQILSERIEVLISKMMKDIIRRLVFDGRYKNPSHWAREAFQEKIDRETKEMRGNDEIL